MCDFLVYVGLFLSLIKFLLEKKKSIFAEPRDEKLSILFLSFVFTPSMLWFQGPS